MDNKTFEIVTQFYRKDGKAGYRGEEVVKGDNFGNLATVMAQAKFRSGSGSGHIAAPHDGQSSVTITVKRLVEPDPLPAFTDGEWQSDAEIAAPFRIIPEVVVYSPHGTVQMHDGMFRSLYRNGQSYFIGDKLHVESKIGRLWKRA